MGHWYARDGQPRYDAGLRVARKERLLPSVTTIENVIASPGLENYKLQQLLMSAQTLTRLPDEADSQYMARVRADADRHRKDAAKLGTVVHHLIERYLAGRDLFFVGERRDVWKIFEQARRWIDENIQEVYATECILTDTLYAGKADAIVRMNGATYIMDWKTTDPAGKLKKNGEPGKGKMAYPSHCRQLAALKAAYEIDPCARVMNVYISTNPDIPGVWGHEWSKEEVAKGYAEFMHAVGLWYSLNQYEAVA